jgi:alkanesulfonate monooxygenase
MHIGGFLGGGATTGAHAASWRHPQAAADAGVNLRHFIDISRTAERGCFDFVFLADNAMVREAANPEALARSAQYIANFEPLTLIGALCAVVKRIGFVATASTSWNEPYNIARVFASLDHQSAGRVAWNIVTSSVDNEARNYGQAKMWDHGVRYERAREFTNVVRGLWDSWADDAFVRDKASGIFFDPAKVRRLNHRGTHFTVEGPLNVARAPQGHPVLVQAGASDDGREFAAEFAEAVFTNPPTLEIAQAYYADVKAGSIHLMPGISPIVGRTEAEAREQFDYLQSLVHPVVGLEMLTTLLGTDLSGYPLDGPLPELERPRGGQSAFENWTGLAKRENLTIRQLIERTIGARGKSVVVGTPVQIADHMQTWFENGAADGFNVMPPYLPGALNDFVDLVIPELQSRGIFRTGYEGTTLRENLGLARPERTPDPAPSERAPVA